MTIATKQKHQLLPLSLNLLLHGVKVEKVAEHRLLGIIIDNKLRWHTDTLCKTLSKRVFLLSKLKYIVDTDTLKLFFNAHVKSHIDYASVVWGGCSDALKKRLNSLLRRSGKLILLDKNLTTDQKLNKIGILNLHKQLDYNKGVFLCIGLLLTMRQCTYLASTKLPTLSPETNTFSRQSQEQIYSKQALPFLMPCFGLVFQCTSDNVTHSAPSRETP